MTFPRITACVAGTLPFTALLAFPAPAAAVELGVKIEPGLAVPLTSPQSQRFDAGGEVSFKGYVGLGRYFDVQAGVGFLGLGASDGAMTTTAGTAWSVSLGLRFKRPHDAAIDRGGFYAASPWIDADTLYVRTGDLNRFGLTAGVGVSFPVTSRRNFWLGPFVRYMEIVQPSRMGFDDTDARLLFVGLNFEIGQSPLAALLIQRPPADCPYCQPVLAAQPDRDHDGVPDALDRCPDVAGPIENGGCPVYKKVIVKEDKLELREKIMFTSNSADIEQESLPLLDEVVQALEDNKGFRVQIEGHSDSSGPDERNQALSEQRADAVLGYLRGHGIARERLSSRGFSSSEPSESDKTAAGRESNRRVEFVVRFIILDRSAQ